MYGGTKSEMERLLADAQKISGVKYDISNLSDVYSAIHVIQTELNISGYSTDELKQKLSDMSLSTDEVKKVAEDMGISYDEAMQKMKDGTLSVQDAQILLGTTTKEASTTISGSINAMKSAWTNLLTGMGDSNADMNKLTSNLVESVGTVAKNLTPVIKNVVQSISTVLPDLLQTFIPQITSGIPDLIEQLLPAVSDGVVTLLSSLVDILPDLISTLGDMLPDIVESLMEGLIEIGGQLAEQLPEIIPELITAIIGALAKINEHFDEFLLIGLDIIKGLVQGIINSIPIIIENLPTILTSIINFFGMSKFLKIGTNVVKGLWNGIKALKNSLGGWIKSFAKTVLDFFKNPLEGIKNIGKNLVHGLWNGIKNAKDWVLKKIKGFGKDVLNGLKDFFGIKSPSTLFRDEVGKYLAQGIGVGFETEMKNVSNSMSNAIPTNFDVTPNIQAGFTSSGSLLDSNNSGQTTNNSNFTAVINNNSKYTTPSENVRKLRQEHELYRLKYGKAGA